MPGRRFMRFLQTLWRRLEDPVVVVHLAVTILSVLSIAGVELLLSVLGLEGKAVPGTALLFRWLRLDAAVTLSDWMLVLELVAATAIIIVGIVKAIITLVRT